MKLSHRGQARRSTAAVAAVAAGLLFAACSPAPANRAAREETYPYWEKRAGAPEAAAFMKIRIPQDATEVRGAVRVQPQENIHLLSFITDEKTAESIADDLRPDHPLRSENTSTSLSGDGFEHLGLTPPQDIEGVRTTSACPPCVGDTRRSEVQGIELHIGGDSGGRVRVYLTAY
ncbi:hypothetical protein AB0E67_17190 [Streptomyces sp. NPDC032161]|uniref:hypothetical protein n=1 Tax=unclassified Streptomyces TaxID=2593676 RepID=UPI0033E56875